MLSTRSIVAPVVLIAIVAGASHAQCDPATTYESFEIEPSFVTSDFLLTTVADFDGDGDNDIISNDYLFWNEGNGTLAPAIELTQSLPVIPQVGDLNGDGLPDLVGLDGEIALSNGDGTFTLSTFQFGSPVAAFPLVGFVDIADMNSDGAPDIIYASNGDGVIEIFFNDGNGLFPNPADVVIDAEFVREVAAADFDNDGDLDIYTLGPATPPRVGDGTALFVNDGNLGFMRIQDFPGAFEAEGDRLRNSNLRVADIDGDGGGDLEVVYRRGVSAADTFSVVRLIGDGSLTPWPQIFVAGALADIGDFDSDGDIDFFMRDEGIVVNRANEGFPDQFLLPAAGSPWGRVADMDNDGDLDIVRTGGDSAAPFIEVLRNVCIENPVVTVSPMSTLVDSGDAATLSASVSGADTFRWIRNGQPIFDDGRVTGTDTDTLTIDPALPGDTDVYALTATNSNGTSTSGPAVISVRGQAGPPCLGDANGDGIVDLADLNAVLAAFGQACP